MDIYDKIMKGPPKWFIRFAIIAAVFTVALQIGHYRGRQQASERSISGLLADKENRIQSLTCEADTLRKRVDNLQLDLGIEQKKLFILLCESGIRHEGVWGDGGKSYGIAQFQYATFADLRRKAGKPGLRWKSRQDQVWLLDWALRNGYGSYWTCYRQWRQK